MGIKLNIGCGTQILPKEDGWINLDPRTELHKDITLWQWGKPLRAILPSAAVRAELIYVGYSFIYCEKEKYLQNLCEMFANLKKSGRVVIKEDDDRKRIWRKQGTVHETGTILSTSNKPEMIELMREAGFQVIDGFFAEDWDRFLDTHRFATRKSYILTGIK